MIKLPEQVIQLAEVSIQVAHFSSQIEQVATPSTEKYPWPQWQVGGVVLWVLAAHSVHSVESLTQVRQYM